MDDLTNLIAAAGTERSGLRKLRDLTDPTVLQVLNYWYAQRGSRRMPTPSDINPVDLPKALRHLMMLQVDYDPFQISYRLIGEHIAESHGANFRGLSVLDINATRPHLGTLLFELFKAVAELRRPVGAGGKVEFPGGGYMNFEAAYMPLSMDGERTDRILTATAYRPISAAERFSDEFASA